MSDFVPASAAGSEPDRPAPWQEPVRGGYPEAALFGLSGVEQLQTMLAGRTPRPPISRLSGLQLVEVGEGTAAFQLPLTGWLCCSQGTISIGPASIAADAAVACAIQTTLPPATPFTTSELSLRMLSPVQPRGLLTARGKLIQIRRTIALAEVALFDEADRILAHGSSLCFVADSLSPPPDLPRASPWRDPACAASEQLAPGTPDPYLRPVEGQIVSEGVWQTTRGLDVLRGQVAGRIPMAPIHRLTGLRPTEVDQDAVTFVMPASEWLCAPPRDRVQGGAVALLAETALSAASLTRIPAGSALASVDLKVNYLRPLAADGRYAYARGRVVHTGRRIAVANAEVFDADGRAIAVATGSAMVLQDRPASLRAVADPATR